MAPEQAAAGPAEWLAAARAWVERELARRLDPAAVAWPGGLAEAMRYAALGPGKRLRPALVLLWCEALGGERARAAAPACAVEAVHAYSLVHDDLPCMDDDDLRRGRPTCHKVFGEAGAVLAGDGLLTVAFEWLGAEPRGGELCAALARAAGPAGMVGGQVLDLASEAEGAAAEGVRAIHAAKTAALIAGACELGALAAGAGGGATAGVHAYGRALGLCFQAVDDLLDVTGDARTLGKTPGKDERLERATLVSALGLEGARAEAERRAQQARDAAAALGQGPDSLAAALVDRMLARRS